MHTEFLILSIVWIIVLIPEVMYQWRRRDQRIGIVLTYLVFLTAAHFLQGVVYAFPWYEPLYDPAIILRGYFHSVLALACFVAGASLIGPSLARAHRRIISRSPQPTRDTVGEGTPSALPIAYITAGMLSYSVLIPLLGDVPTLGAFLSGIHRLYHIGLVLAIWQVSARATASRRRWLAIIALVTIIWPILTITRDGFLGFGLIPTVLISTYAASQFGRARTLLIVAPLAAFIGLSVVITYFSQRTLIRNVAWGDTDTETRLSTIFDVFANQFESFDPFNSEQLVVIDQRLALNRLAGLGIERLNSGIVPYAEGRTISDAVLMLLPRAIWPDKPIVVGGQALVNEYTGVYMHGSTSVALGQVLEFYVNFGTLGIILGFIGLGMLLSYLDMAVARSLAANNLFRAAILLAPCFGLWLVEDNLITAVGSSVSAAITVLIFNMGLRVVLRVHDRNRPSGVMDANAVAIGDAGQSAGYQSDPR